MSLLNPLHPGSIFIQKRLGKQLMFSLQVSMPPASSVVAQITPPSGTVWIMGIASLGDPRDAATGNPVISGLYYATHEHPMIRTYSVAAYDSVFKYQWPTGVDVTNSEPWTITVVNNTALTILHNFSFAILEIYERSKEDYDKLWNGLYNLLYLLGSFDQDDKREVDTLYSDIKKVLQQQ